MKTPEEIKKGLEHCSEDGCKGCNYKEDCDMADGFSVLAFDALACIQQLEAQVQKWISVEERLPEEIKRDDAEVSSSDLVIVAVCDDMDNIFVADDIVCAGEWVNYPAPLFEVTHWMPLPEPPKEG